MKFHIGLFVNLISNTNQKLHLVLHLLELWKLWKLINIKSNKKSMHVKCDLMAWNTSRHVVPFIWNKMLKFRTSKTIYNHDA
jgi:hypothetical protein